MARDWVYSAVIVLTACALMLGTIAAWGEVQTRPTYKMCGHPCAECGLVSEEAR